MSIPVSIKLSYRVKLRLKGEVHNNVWILKINYGNFFGISVHDKKPNKRIIRKFIKQVKRVGIRSVGKDRCKIK